MRVHPSVQVRRAGLAGGMSGLMLLAAGAPAAAAAPAGHNPPGNNGTVKVHDVADDHSPHNVAHVTCRFWVDFFGFDRDQHATLTFTGQAPTGKSMTLLSQQHVLISNDDAGGAGQDWDSEMAFTADQLGVSRLGAPAAQGYHVRFSVEVDGAPGGAKQKVFWISPCGQAPTTSAGRPTQSSTNGSSTQSGQTSSGGGSTAGTVTTSGTGPATGSGSSRTTSGGSTSAGRTTASGSRPTTSASGATAAHGTQVLGLSLHRAAPESAPGTAVLGSQTGARPTSGLPFTGPAGIVALTALGLGAAGAGTALVVAGRRRRAAHTG